MDLYQKVADDTAQSVLSMAKDQSSWKFMKTTSNVMISYMQSPFFSGNAWKFKTLVPASFDVVWNLLKPGLSSGPKPWDNSIAHYSVVRPISSDKLVAHILTHAAVFGAVASRELITLFCSKEDTPQVNLDPDYGKTNWIFARSVEDVKFPICSSPVRAINYPTGYLIAECKSDPNKCYVELYINTDIGGLLPQSLVEIALPGQQVNYLQSVIKEAQNQQSTLNCSVDKSSFLSS